VWYLAEILFAEPAQPDRAEYHCESCDVVLQAADATQAYQKAVTWGLTYAAEPPSAMRLLGVSHLTTIGEELGDGTEICGRFFEVQSKSVKGSGAESRSVKGSGAESTNVVV
jgi:hypothetical protein